MSAQTVETGAAAVVEPVENAAAAALGLEPFTKGEARFTSREKRTHKTEYLVKEGKNKDGQPAVVVVALTTTHWGERKCFNSRLGYFVRHRSTSGYWVETFMVFGQAQVNVHAEHVARYSPKRLDLAHEAATLSLAQSIADEEPKVLEVFREAFAKDLTAEH